MNPSTTFDLNQRRSTHVPIVPIVDRFKSMGKPEEGGVARYAALTPFVPRSPPPSALVRIQQRHVLEVTDVTGVGCGRFIGFPACGRGGVKNESDA